MKVLLLLFVIFLGLAASGADNKKVEVAKQVDPDWGPLTSGFIVEQRDLDLGVDAGGEPFSIYAKASIPDPVVRSLAQWRFKSGGFVVPLKVPVRIKLTPWVERAQSLRWTFHGPSGRRQ